MNDRIYEIENSQPRGKKRTLQQASMECDIAFKDLQSNVYRYRARNYEEDQALLRELVRKGNLNAIAHWIDLQKQLIPHELK